MPNKTEIRCFKRWLQLKELDQKGFIAKSDSIADEESPEPIYSQQSQKCLTSAGNKLDPKANFPN